MSTKSALELDFYCDACVEVANEAQIEVTLSSREAGRLLRVVTRDENRYMTDA